MKLARWRAESVNGFKRAKIRGLKKLALKGVGKLGMMLGAADCLTSWLKMHGKKRLVT